MPMILNEKPSITYDVKNERRFIFLAIFILTLFGILLVYESSCMYAYKITGDPAYFFKKQLTFFLFGLVGFFLTLLVNLDFLRRHNRKILISTIVILIGLAVIGKTAGGAKRWLTFGGFNFQPSELLKISFLIYCADYFTRKENLIKNLKEGLIPLGVVLGTICFLLLIQPDLGTAAFWVLWSFIFIFLYGAQRKHLLAIAGIGLFAAVLLVVLFPYRFRRMTAYFNPFANPRDAGFQLIQSQIAYGEGGIFGVGLGESRQKLFFLPAAHTDFIFSIIAEEFGLIGSLGLLVIFFILFRKMFNMSKIARDIFARNILWGITLIFFLEVVINVGVSCGLFPTKGLPLPFISYGGSNLFIHFILLALFFNASRVESGISQMTTNEKLRDDHR